MDKERRSMEDAFEVSADVEQFIAKGFVEPVKEVGTSGAKSKAASNNDGSRGSGGAATGSEAETVSSGDRPRKKRRSKSTGRRSAEISQEQMTRMYAKATVQKTVRFQPALIARLESWVRERESEGDTPISFQQIQNDALRLWLDTHRPHNAAN